MHRNFPRPSPEAMLASSVATIISLALGDGDKASDETTMSKAHLEAAKCVLLEDYYGNRKKEILNELGFDEGEAAAFVDVIRSMFL
jgi:hypothetical protein